MKFHCGDIDYVYSQNSNSPSYNNCDGQDVNQDFVLDYIKSKLPNHENEFDSFLVCNMDDVEFKFKQWELSLPRVKPFYAIKCNPDPLIIRYLAMQGTGFDCASKNEIEQVLAANVSPSRIIFANPCKFSKHIQAAEQLGIQRTTFDSVAELQKVARLWPSAELVIRVLPKVFKAQCPLGLKFGATEDEVPELLQQAKELNLKVIGVSFHVGSGCLELDAWSDSVRFARRVFDLAESEFGFKPYLLDVGGGFPGSRTPSGDSLSFTNICESLNAVLDECFPADGKVKYEIIAEPGRYFVASAFTLATNVHSVRKAKLRKDSENGRGSKEQVTGYHYYISDGLYGSFNNIMFDHAVVSPVLFHANGNPIPEDKDPFLCKVFGPTCDSADIILENVKLPKLEVGDWLIWYEMGAYTHAASSTFNGIARPSLFYIREISLEVLEAQKYEMDKCQREAAASSSEDEEDQSFVQALTQDVYKYWNIVDNYLKSDELLRLVSPMKALKQMESFTF